MNFVVATASVFTRVRLLGAPPAILGVAFTFAFALAASTRLDAAAATVTTSAVQSITSTSVTFGGNVTSDGGATVVTRGIVYALAATNNNPQLAGNGVSAEWASSGGTGAFTINVSNLTPNATYAWAAYAANSAGTAYSAPAFFVNGPTGSTGSATAVDNTQPTLAVRWFICTQGVFPQRDSDPDAQGFVGEIRPMAAGNATPTGWAECNGQVLSIVSNTGLFSVIGAAFGGNGQTTFGLPDLRGRVPVAAGAGPGLTARVVGETGGGEGNVLTTANLPAHTHTYQTVATGSAGSGTALDNTQPWLAVTAFIKIFGAASDIGWIRYFGGQTNYGLGLPCEGQLLSVDVYPDLFARIGTTFGGNGTTTFGLPDLRGRSPMGSGQGTGLTNRAFAASGGAETFALTTATIPAHTHTTTGSPTGSTGGAQTHATVQPFVALDSRIATDGVFNGTSELPALGELRLFAHTTAISGWVSAQGQSLPINTNQAIYSLLGTSYGGNGTTAFNLPDVRGRLLTHAGAGTGLTTRAAGATWGAENVTVTTANLPAHAHLYAAVLTPPTITTPTTASVTATTATLGGDLTSDGGAALTGRGIVYALNATNSNPQIGGNGVTQVVASGTTTGGFTAPVTGLTAASGYTFAAYAINAAGTSYSSPFLFFTNEQVTHGGGELANAADLSGNLGTVSGTTVVYRGRVTGSDSNDTIQISLPAGQTITAATATITNFALGGGSTPLPGQIHVGGTATNYTGNGTVTLTLPSASTSPLTVAVVAPSSQTMMVGPPPLLTTFHGTAHYTVTLTLGSTAPTVSSVFVPPDGTKRIGAQLGFIVNWSEATNVVTTGGTPTLSLTIGSTTRTASYVSGSGNQSHVYAYNIQAGDLDTDGITVGTLALNDGTIKSAGGADATLTLNNVGSTAAVLVDGIVPTLSSVTLTSSNANPARAKVGDVITLRFTASEPLMSHAVRILGQVVGPTSSGNDWTAVYTLNATEGSEGTVSIEINPVDLAGNAGVAVMATTNSSSVTFDRTAPALTTARIALTGATSTGGAFKIGDTLTAAWNNSASGDNNADVASVALDLSTFGGGSAVTATNASGTWSASLTLAAGSLDATNRNVVVTATDTTGNIGSLTGTNNATLDTTAPVVTAAKIALTGATGAGGVFKIGDTVTATWDNTSATGDNNADLAAVSVNFSAFGGGTAVTATDSTGTWSASYTLVAGTLEASNLNVAVTATDDAGNATTRPGTNNATVDTLAPAAPSTPDLVTASDTGASPTDNLTNVATPVFTGTAVASSTVRLYDTDGTTLLGSATATGGAWSITATTLTPGAHTITAKAIDTAGNLGSASSGLVVTIDTTTPAAPVVTGISADTGASATDGITSDPTLLINGTAEADATVTVSKGGNPIGTTLANGTGAWSFDYTATTLSAGDHSFTAIATDGAGNPSGTSNIFVATVDTTITVPTISAITSDTGSSATDRVTSDNTLVFTGTADPSATITILRNGVGAVGFVTANGSGAWSFDYTATALVDGTYIFTATALDLAGNVSAASADFPVTIDTVAPAFPSAVTAGGTYRSAFSFTIVAPTAVSFSSTTLPAGLALDATTGALTGTPTTSGTFPLTITATDLAGNSATQTLTLTLAKIPLTVSGLTSANKIYDSTTTAAVNGTPLLGGVLGADTGNVTLSGFAVGNFSDALAGTGKTVTFTGLSLTGSAAAHYTLTNPTTTADITVKITTVIGVVANGKTYDGATTATLNFTNASVVGLNPGDTVRLLTGGATATFATPDAGPNKIVTITGIALGGMHGANYTLTQPVASASISPAPAAITLSNLAQTYDGTARVVSVATAPAGLPVSLTYNNAATAVDAGTYAVAAAITSGNHTGSALGTLVVARAAQTLTFAPITLNGATATLSATASTGLPVTFSVVSGSATISGATLTTTGTGTVVVRASQAGGTNFAPVTTDQTITVTRRVQTIAFGAIPNRRASDPAFTITATATSGLPVTLTLVSGPATLAGNTITLSGSPGAVTVRASQAGNADFAAAPEVTQSFNVLALGQQVFFGLTQDNDTVALTLAADGRSGTFVIYLRATSEAFVVDFTVNADGTFSAVVAPFSPAAAKVGDIAHAGPPRTFRGRIEGSSLTGSVVELGLAFSATAQPANGASASVSGLYRAPATNGTTGETISVVGTQGQVFAVAITATSVAAGTGTLTSANTFAVAATGNALIAGAIDATTTSVSGTVTVSGGVMQTFSGAAATAARTDRLINLSSRSRVAPAAGRTLIAGFVINGNGSKRILLRAVGPALTGFGIAGALANPRLQLFDSTGRVLAENDDWSGADLSSAFAQVGAFTLGTGTRDAALLATLAPGAYTMQITAANGTDTGVGLAEIYDASVTPANESPRLINLSTRGAVEAGAEGVLIGGFVVTGNTPKRVLIRGIGPGLAAFGVTGTLADPRLAIYSGQTIVAQNNDWSTPAADSSATAVSDAARNSGAFALAANSRDAAVVLTLAPGAYTAQVTSSDGTTGAALVEVYEVP